MFIIDIQDIDPAKLVKILAKTLAKKLS